MVHLWHAKSFPFALFIIILERSCSKCFIRVNLQLILRLWARTISSNLHGSLDEPPNIPAFCGSAVGKKKRIEGLIFSSVEWKPSHPVHTLSSNGGGIFCSTIVMSPLGISVFFSCYDHFGISKYPTLKVTVFGT